MRRIGGYNQFLEDFGNKIFSESALKFHLLFEWLCCLLVLLIISEKNNSEIIFFAATVIAISLLLSVIGLLSDAPKMLYPFVFVMLTELILSMTLMILTFLRQSDQNLFKIVINHVPEFDRLFGFLFRLPQWLSLLILSICAAYSYICFLTTVSVIPKIELRTAQERLIRRRLAEAYNMGMVNPDGLMRGPYVHIIQNGGPQFMSENPDSPPHYSVLTDSQKTPPSGKSPSPEKSSDKDETAPPRYSQLETFFRNGRFRRQKQVSTSNTRALFACRVPDRVRMFLSSSSRKNESDISAKSETLLHSSQQNQQSCQNAEGSGNSNSCSSTLTPCTPQNSSRKDGERGRKNEHNQRQSSSPHHIQI
ncbi:hypothetical protein WR25_10366 [Diploscapter pachys]|uniref:Uncharacterized protein n=1 Tax=Diploscapter pachys TaxID=2018661 RepID=A0A2A2JHJ2_9BILA|nr:hypothetical protein WR25_10366 [Diploscapter pachys]